MSTPEHELKDKLLEVEEIPAHPVRKGESAEFLAAVKRLKADGHYKCWVCGSTENLQVHHLIAEWSLANAVDLGKCEAVGIDFDPYGYGISSNVNEIPWASVDDVRNLLVLCQPHHTGQITGIHSTTFSAWVSQRLAKDGVTIVPQDRHQIEELEGNGTPDTNTTEGQ